jgi:N utilization substance protein B
MVTSKERLRVRELAMQVLFAWDAAQNADKETARQITHDGSDNPVVRQMAVDLARNTWDQREMIDQRVERFTPNWPPRRQPAVDRNLLRLAVYEMTNKQIAPQIVIDTYLMIARDYSTSASSAFVNAVLDAIVKEHNALLAGLPTPAAPAAPVPAPAEGTGPGQVHEDDDGNSAGDRDDDE